MKINFYMNKTLENIQIKYVIIAAMYRENWVFVRHRDRSTWELPAGHIENGETPEVTANRELYEETGAEKFHLKPVSLYSVSIEDNIEYGYLFYADIKSLAPIPSYSEISEISFGKDLPEELTYPLIQPAIFKKVLKSFKKTEATI